MTDHLYSSVFGYLAEPALRSLILAGAAGLILAVTRVKTSSARLASWTGVLYAALAMPLLSMMLPSLRVPVMSAPTSVTYQTVATERQVRAGLGSINSSARARVSLATRRNSKAAPLRSPLERAVVGATLSNDSNQGRPWQRLAILLYVLIAVILLARTLIGLLLARRMRRSAILIDDNAARECLRKSAGRAVVKAPALAESSLISVPVTIGLIRPMILLPSNWRSWESAKLRAVLSHELSHVRRRDTLTQMASHIHRALFWFSPLSWWLHRQLLDLAEQASDDQAMSSLNDANYYAEILLGFFEAARTGRGRVRLAGVCMAQGSRAERRIDRILSARPGSFQGSFKNARRAVLTFTLLLPLIYVAAAVVPSAVAPKSAMASANSDILTIGAGQYTVIDPVIGPVLSGVLRPTKKQSASTTDSEQDSRVPLLPPCQGPKRLASPPLPGLPPLRPLPVAEVLTPPEPCPPAQAITIIRNWNSDQGPDDAFVVVIGKHWNLESGSEQDIERARALKSRMGGDFIWFRKNGKEYVITDPGAIKAARELFAGQEKLGSQQSELGRKQAELGRQQAELGRRQSELGRQQSQMQPDTRDLNNRIRELQRQMRVSKSEEESEKIESQIDKLTEEIDRLQEKVDRERDTLGKQQDELGNEQDALGRKQDDLGRMQDKLGREQDELAREAERKLHSLLEQALRDGIAHPAP